MPQQTERTWLYGRRFDLMLIVGVLALALVLGGVASLSAELFATILLLDFWLLAYPHVASTFTRVACDRGRVRQHWVLLFALPPLVFGGTAALTLGAGVIALNTLYFTWQTWHYTRQSYGIARAYARKAGEPLRGDNLSTLLIYLFPLWGYLHRAAQGHDTFYGMPLFLPAIPTWFEYIVAGTTLAVFAAWVFRALKSRCRSSLPHNLFVLSHIVISTVSYLVMGDITEGWLFINIWHNAQYLLFVWAANVRRHHQAQPVTWFSRLCQPRRALWYAIVCFVLGGLFYSLLGAILGRSTWNILPLVLIGHMAVNFHHYLIDAVIWRRRKRIELPT